MRALALVSLWPLWVGCHDFDDLTRCSERACDAAISMTCDDNLALNGAFEASLIGWNANHASLMRVSDDPHGGSGAARLCQTMGDFYAMAITEPGLAVSNPAPVGARFRVDVWVRTSSGTGEQPVLLYFREWSSTTQFVTFNAGAITATPTWTQLSGSYTVASADRRLDFYISAEPATGTGCIDVDDVCVIHAQ